jgi:RNA polymerase sigma factor (sigma-70 family)
MLVSMSVASVDDRADAELLASTRAEPEAFAVFYRRHVRAVLGYLMGRTGRAEICADLCAEVFAKALEQTAAYDARRGPARAWLLAIAHSTLVDSVRRGQVEDRARRRLGMPARELADADLERIEEIAAAGTSAGALVADLPAEQRDAVRARIVEERDYADIAHDLAVSQAVVRKRVSRGLATLRTRLDEGGS